MELRVQKMMNGLSNRVAYENGHLLLLFASEDGRRTFKEFPTRIKCIEGITEVYERYIDPEGKTKPGDYTYVFDDVWNYLDSFRDVILFEYQAEISRYKQYNRDQIKELMVAEVSRLD